MTMTLIGDAQVDVDAEGFMTNPEQWNEQIAESIAAENGVPELSDRHWQVVKFMRERYLATSTAPSVARPGAGTLTAAIPGSGAPFSTTARTGTRTRIRPGWGAGRGCHRGTRLGVDRRRWRSGRRHDRCRRWRRRYHRLGLDGRTRRRGHRRHPRLSRLRDRRAG